MTNEEMVDYYVDKVFREEIPFDQVRKELESKGFNEHDIKAIVRLVDSEIQNRLLAKNRKNNFDQLILVGSTLSVIGFIVTLGSFLGLFTMGSNVIVIAYGPLFGGLAILFVGLRKKRRKNLSGAAATKRTIRMRNRSHNENDLIS